MRQFVNLLKRFQSDERGAFLALFGVLAIVLIAMAGAVVDYTSVEQARTRAQVAIDAAALALHAKIYDQNYDIKNAAEPLIINRIGDSRINAEVTSAVGNTTTGTLTLTARLTVPMYFVALVGVNSMSVEIESTATRGSKDVEVAVALDITLSMQGTKISDLRAATAELIDLVVKDVQTPTYSKMALVPYSNGVNVGTYADAARGPVTTYTNITAATWWTGTARTVSAINKANPARITTSVAHGFSDGDTVYFTGISGGGFTNLNTTGGTTKSYVIDVTSTTQFTLNGVSTSSYSGSYSGSSGTVRKCITNECEMQITSSAHGLQNNDVVYITNINGATGLNNQLYSVSDRTANTFILEGTDGPDYQSSTYSSGGRAYCTIPGCYYYYFQAENNSWKLWTISTCVTERVGANQYTNAAPSTTYVGRSYPSPTASLGTCPDTTIQPLSSNKTLLKNIAANLDVAGSTAGQTGLAWAWYMVSPSFSYMLPSASQPDSMATNQNLVKVVVLMTDGAFNTGYCNGVTSQNYGVVGSSDSIKCNATNGNPFTQATSLCTAIKRGDDGILGNRDDIILYTVAFDIGNDAAAISFMSGCATDAEHAYEAADGDDLSDVFREIGAAISALRISE